MDTIKEAEARSQASDKRAHDAEQKHKEILSELESEKQNANALRLELDEKNSALSALKEELRANESRASELPEKDSLIKALQTQLESKDKSMVELREEMQRREEEIALAAKTRIDKVKENARAQLPNKIKDVVSRAYFELEKQFDAHGTYQGEVVLSLVLGTLKSTTLGEAGGTPNKEKGTPNALVGDTLNHHQTAANGNDHRNVVNGEQNGAVVGAEIKPAKAESESVKTANKSEPESESESVMASTNGSRGTSDGDILSTTAPTTTAALQEQELKSTSTEDVAGVNGGGQTAVTADEKDMGAPQGGETDVSAIAVQANEVLTTPAARDQTQTQTPNDGVIQLGGRGEDRDIGDDAGEVAGRQDAPVLADDEEEQSGSNKKKKTKKKK
jgi:hypothetical protein